MGVSGKRSKESPGSTPATLRIHTRSSALLFSFLSCAYWVYPNWITKVLPILFLAALGAHNNCWVAFAGLVMSACGDVALELENGADKLFIAGIACFLVAHLCYARAFATTTATLHEDTRTYALPICFAVYVLLLYVLLPAIAANEQDLIAPVVVYGLVISSMVAAAFNRHAHQGDSGSLVGLAGATIFFTSDVLIAIDKFRSPFPHAKTCVMVTYYIGQLLIAASLYYENRDASRSSRRGKKNDVDARFRLFLISSVCALCLCRCPAASALQLPVPPVSTRARAQAKAAFLQSVALREPTRATDLALEKLIALLEAVAVSAPLEPPLPVITGVPLGTWQIVFAPHIRALSLLLQTRFDVYYLFQPDNKLLSNVRYTSRIFGSGHLSTLGSYSLADGPSALCSIKWDRVWWDVLDDAPSLEAETERHVLPGVIQAVGKAAFIEGASVFPVQYLDDDLCVFLFKLLGTRICAKRIA